MSESSKRIILEIIIKGKKYELPFPNIECLDNITVQFTDANELTNFLFDCETTQVDNIRIKYSYKKRNTDKIITNYLPVKYNCDAFDEISLRDTLIRYLQEHKTETKNPTWEVLYIIKNARYQTYEQGDFTDREIATAVHKLWTKGYKTKRDKYFMLKQRKIYPIIVPPETYYEKITALQAIINLDEIESSNPYVQYLQSYASLGTEEREYSTEQLSMFDLEELLDMNQQVSQISNNVSQNNYNFDELFAYIGNTPPKRREELLNELYKLRAEFTKTTGKKKCRK